MKFILVKFLLSLLVLAAIGAIVFYKVTSGSM